MVPAVTLAELAAEHGPIDVLRLDCGGLEYQVLSSGLTALDGAVCLEIDGGMVDNYDGQYPLATVSVLLENAGYALAELSTSARPAPADPPGGLRQPVQYHGTWLRDYTRRPAGFTAERAVKLLVLCRELGFRSFGREVAALLHERRLLTDEHHEALQREELWREPWPLPSQNLG
jgi:hypothetical protein